MNDHGEDDVTPRDIIDGVSDEADVEPIAVIGLACRLPGAGSAAQYWENLVNGIESVRFFSRAEQAAAGVPEQDLDDPHFVPAAQVLDEADRFDAALFGMTRREAELRDPQQRLFLELAHTALEDAGYDPARYPGDIGVYGGVGADEYQWHFIRRNPAVMSAMGQMSISVGNHPDYLATLVSHKLNLRGPSLTVHTACSTTLVTLHLACEALRNGECDMALTGGASIELPLNRGYVHADGGILTPDGHTRTFDAAAAGTMWGSGGGVVILKRLSDALADGDHIRAIVRGSAINNDGANKVGFSAPSMEGQAVVVAQALGVAGVDPRTITYVEAHGTATALGDPIEVAALTSAFSQHSDDTGWCGLGSVKTNIGHLGPVAGVAAVIKTVLALEHGLIPASLNFERANPKLNLETSPFYVNATLASWNPDCGVRRAGVSSFGIGGTNAHVILEQAPESGRDRTGGCDETCRRPAHLLRVSARTAGALDTLLERLAGHLTNHPELDLADVAYTLRVGRAELTHRTVVVAKDGADAAAALRNRKRRVTGEAPARVPSVAFLFSGQGAQYAGMGAQLYRIEPVFRRTVDECLAILPGDLGDELRTLLVEVADADAAARQAADARLGRTALAQPALFIVEYALARLWASWGVEPAAMIGHSIGEYVAATLAGVFALPDALGLVVARGRLMQSLPTGTMLAVQLDEADLTERLPDGLSIATINGPRACVVAGPSSLVEEFATELAGDGVGHKKLRTSHAFHSPMMDPILAEFRDLVAAVPRQAPRAAFLSNVTGDWISSTDAVDPSYWARHLRHTVRFGDCLATLLADGEWLLVECGPGRQLAGLARMQTPRDGVPPLASLPSPGEKRTDLEAIYTAAGQLWVRGVTLDADTFAESAHRVPLVPYPYERKRYWVEPTLSTLDMTTRPESAGPRPVDDWFTVPVWRQVLPAGTAEPPRRCLAFRDGPVSAAVVAGLRAAGVEVVEVVPGSGYSGSSDGRYTVRPGERADYDTLLAELATTGGVPDRVVHGWTLDGRPTDGSPQDTWRIQDRGFFSLLNLVQAAAAAQLTIQVDVVTAGTQDVVGADATRPEHATVAGIAKVVPLETPAVTVRHLDLPDQAEPGADLIALTVAELCREPVGAGVALRGGRRWVQAYEPVPVPGRDATLGLRPEGVYLITGGLGGLGITLAEDLARTVRARLVLIARSPLPDRAEWETYPRVNGVTDRAGRAIAAIRRMEAAGAEVLALTADVTSGDELRSVRERTLAAFGRLDGIIHSAGVPGGGMAEVKDRAVAESVLAPKIVGTLQLARVFGDLPLDFVVLFSSVTAVTGGFGQVDYCAANSFLDAYARGEHGWRAPVTSVNWGGWREVGMAAEVAAPAAFRALQQGDRVVTIDHPVITARHVPEEGAPAWAGGVVTPSSHWVLDEHRVSGVPVMPGTGHLENVRCAFVAMQRGRRPVADGRVVELRDVVFVEPMAVDDGAAAEVRVVFTDGTDGLDFEVIGVTAGAGTVHVRGGVGWVDPGPTPTVDVHAIMDRCRLASHDVERDGDQSHSGLLTFGPRWRSLRRVRVGQDEEIALLEAPQIVAAELDRWVLHPALLDEATSFGRAISGGQYLPLGYGRLTVRGPLPARVYSHLRYRGAAGGEVVAADLSLYDEHGREVVSIGDFVLRRVDPSSVTRTVGGAPAAAATAARSVASTETGISPTDGAEAFHRVLANGLGRQVVITAQPLERVFAGVTNLTQETLADEFDPTATAETRTGPTREGYVAPRDALESDLAKIWGAVLGVDAVGADDDFFDLGGNSLIAVQLISQIRKNVGVKLPMRSLFETPTVAGMAGLVNGLRAEVHSEPVPGAVIPRLPRPRA